jgi:hypothetical protein
MATPLSDCGRSPGSRHEAAGGRHLGDHPGVPDRGRADLPRPRQPDAGDRGRVRPDDPVEPSRPVSYEAAMATPLSDCGRSPGSRHEAAGGRHLGDHLAMRISASLRRRAGFETVSERSAQKPSHRPGAANRPKQSIGFRMRPRWRRLSPTAAGPRAHATRRPGGATLRAILPDRFRNADFGFAQAPRGLRDGF